MAKKSLINLITGGNEEGDAPEEALTKPSLEQDDWMEMEGNLTVDVYQDGDDIVIKSTIAGVTEKDLDIEVTADMVTIRGERSLEDEIDTADYYYQELYWGSFSRSIVLPQEIDPDGAKAALEHGVLTVRLPKLERSRTKKLKIN